MEASLWLCGASNVKVIRMVQAILRALASFGRNPQLFALLHRIFSVHSFTFDLSTKHMIFHLILQDCLFGRDCQSGFLSSKYVRSFCILSNFVVNNSNIYFPLSLAALQIECRTFSPSHYIMFCICKTLLGTISMVSAAMNTT